jgi:hypothetical protein
MALDMPISKSTLLLHYSPLFRLTPAPGSFRVAPYEPPSSTVLRAGADPAGVRGAQPPPAEKGEGASPAQQAAARAPQPARAVRQVRNLPIRVSFPRFGPSLFLVAELTSENQTPVLELDYQRDKKRGEK